MRERRRRTGPITREAAEAIAAQALLFLAQDSARLGRFLAETGLDPRDFRGGLREPAMLAAVMAYLMADESALLAFAANAGLEPEDVARAEITLGGGSPWEST
jgi:hypothetical protein